MVQGVWAVEVPVVSGDVGVPVAVVARCKEADPAVTGEDRGAEVSVDLGAEEVQVDPEDLVVRADYKREDPLAPRDWEAQADPRDPGSRVTHRRMDLDRGEFLRY